MAEVDLSIFAVTALRGDVVSGTDGRIGTIKDFLFVDDRWRIRWLVVDTGTWLPGRKILIHPSAIEDIDLEQDEVTTSLTKQQVEGSPGVRDGQSVSADVEARLLDYYGWDRDWGTSLFAPATREPPAVPGAIGKAVEDPHLRSFEAITRCKLRATDGEIGRAEDFLIDRAGWNIRYLIVSTGVWLLSKDVLLAPYAVSSIDWLNHEIVLNVTRKQLEESPPWDPVTFIDEVYAQKLHRHYNWPSY